MAQDIGAPDRIETPAAAAVANAASGAASGGSASGFTAGFALPPIIAADESLARKPLLDRIVSLPSAETFRTKLKVKAPAVEPRLALNAEAKAPGRSDDLTRIRGIDATLASRLATVGVTRFAQIAGWGQGDVQTISQTLDLGRTVSRQNWIEQAALLAAKPDTQRVAEPELVAAAPVLPVQSTVLPETVKLAPVVTAAELEALAALAVTPAEPALAAAMLPDVPALAPLVDVPVEMVPAASELAPVLAPVLSNAAAAVPLFPPPAVSTFAFAPSKPLFPPPSVSTFAFAPAKLPFPPAPVSAFAFAPAVAAATVAAPAPVPEAISLPLAEPPVVVTVEPAAALLLPRVVPVDSLGDAGFHRPADPWLQPYAAAPEAVSDVPAIGAGEPLPLLPSQAPPVDEHTPSMAAAAPALAEVIPPAVVMDLAAAPAGFELASDWAPEAEAIAEPAPVSELAPASMHSIEAPATEAAAQASLAQAAVPQSASDASFAAALEPAETLPHVDDVLAGQLHSALAAAADDRAVAATVDLLAAFSPPPVADDPGFPGAHPWPPAPDTSYGGQFALPADAPAFAPEAVADVAADLAFNRWVPTTPRPMDNASAWSNNAWGAPVAPVKEAAPSDVPLAAYDNAPDVSATLSPVAFPAVAAPEVMTPAPVAWSRPAYPAMAMPVPAPEPVAAAPAAVPDVLEPVAPSMLDRLASLEAELTALAANDQPRAHTANYTATEPARPVVPAGASAVNMPPPPPRYLPSPAPAGTSVLRSADAARDLRFDDPLPGPADHRVAGAGEADVMIVARGDQLEIRPVAPGPSLGTIEQRLRRARPVPEVDVDTYAGYHATISEASVEIVRRDAHTRAVVFANGEGPDESGTRGGEGSIRRFFKALAGKSN
jgi:predicted flap endonuclease-1-like 5' DNA nuclease